MIFVVQILNKHDETPIYHMGCLSRPGSYTQIYDGSIEKKTIRQRYMTKEMLLERLESCISGCFIQTFTLYVVYPLDLFITQNHEIMITISIVPVHWHIEVINQGNQAAYDLHKRKQLSTRILPLKFTMSEVNKLNTTNTSELFTIILEPHNIHVSNMVTSDRSVVTSRTILPGTTSGITTKLPQDMTTNRVLGKRSKLLNKYIMRAMPRWINRSRKIVLILRQLYYRYEKMWKIKLPAIITDYI
ncbi:hypothetical protein AGLY_010574 [Aphis glycines]|uniref:Uncharacterized protein n=1 Tax=Aphis glycines TaxID=307491 RepID=A0A6G0TEC5_APHGL|nr:hypothetical protein AGLY_010574 [Aphis glycines]